MNIDDILQYSTTITVTTNEAVLLDWVLTAHSWDTDLIGRLIERHGGLREKIGLVLVGHTKEIALEHDEIDLLLAIIPIIFSIGTEEVGSALKKKLWECVVGAVKKPDVKNDNEEYYGEMLA